VSGEDKLRYFRDAAGALQVDRRRGDDRRQGETARQHEQRKFFRRKADRELYETDHKTMIEEALQDFADEHGGRI